MKKFKKYDKEYRRQIVQYVLETGKSVAQVADERDIPRSTLRDWMEKFSGQVEVADGRSSHLENRYAHDLEEENMILGKAMYFLLKKDIGNV